MKKIILNLLFLGGIMSGANLKTVDIAGIKIPVIYEQSKLIPIGTVQLVFKSSGSAYNQEAHGLAYLSSLLLNEGTKDLGGTEFARALEKRAITLYASSSQEFLEFSLSFLKDEQKNALALLSDLIQSPNLTEDALQKVKAKATASLLTKENDFDYLASTGLAQLLFKNTPLQFPSRGTVSSIKAMTLSQVQTYIQNTLTLNKLLLVIGGDIDIDSALEKLSVFLSKLPIGEKPTQVSYTANGDSQSKTQYKPTEQAYIYFGAPFDLKDYKQEAYKAKVMSFILGASGFGSRIMEEIRVKNGLAYSAYMMINTSKLVNYVSGHLQTKVANQNQSIALVKEVVEKFIAQGATQEELESAKKFLLGSEPLRNETLHQRLSLAFKNYYLGLPLNYQKEELNLIKNLTLQELNAFIQSHKEILKLSFSIVTK